MALKAYDSAKNLNYANSNCEQFTFIYEYYWTLKI